MSLILARLMHFERHERAGEFTIKRWESFLKTIKSMVPSYYLFLNVTHLSLYEKRVIYTPFHKRVAKNTPVQRGIHLF